MVVAKQLQLMCKKEGGLGSLEGITCQLELKKFNAYTIKVISCNVDSRLLDFLMTG